MTSKKNTSSLLNRDLAASFSFWKPDILTEVDIFPSSVKLCCCCCCCSSPVDLTAERLSKTPPTPWRNGETSFRYGLLTKLKKHVFQNYSVRVFTTNSNPRVCQTVLIILCRPTAIHMYCFYTSATSPQTSAIADARVSCFIACNLEFGLWESLLLMVVKSGGEIKSATECVTLFWRTETCVQTVILPNLFTLW